MTWMESRRFSRASVQSATDATQSSKVRVDDESAKVSLVVTDDSLTDEAKWSAMYNDNNEGQ